MGFGPVIFLNSGRGFLFDPVVSALFQFQCQAFVAGLDDSAIHHHMHIIRLDVVEQSADSA